MADGAHFVLSAFADEISDDLQEQVKTLRELNVPGLDLRSVGGTNVLSLTDEQLADVRKACDDNGLHVEAIGSPVNKVRYSPEALPQELDNVRRSIHAAQITGTKKIRIFSPEVPVGQDDQYWPSVRDWMAAQRQLAADAGMVLMHENDGRFFGAYPANAHKLLDELGSPNFRAIYDFANSVLFDQLPMRDWFPWILPHLVTLHIKDALATDRKVVPAGEGDGQMGDTLAFLIAQGWNGTLTLEPHLKSGGPYGGTSGPELFKVAVEAIRKVVESVGGTC